jgi:hypothetical protein
MRAPTNTAIGIPNRYERPVCIELLLYRYRCDVFGGLAVRGTAVRVKQFFMELYNDQRNAQVFNLFIYLLLPYMFRAFF